MFLINLTLVLKHVLPVDVFWLPVPLVGSKYNIKVPTCPHIKCLSYLETLSPAMEFPSHSSKTIVKQTGLSCAKLSMTWSLKELSRNFTTKLENIDKCLIRGEYKTAIYSRYLLPSLRFHMSIHSIHQTQLDKLDHLARKYLKSWLKIPARGVTDLSIFHPYMLGVKPPSQLYLEGHAGNYLNSIVRGDPVVKEALAVAVNREEVWSRKSSSICESRDIFMEVSDTCFVPTPENTYHFNAACRHSLPTLKKQTNKIIANKYLEKYNKQAEESPFQGDFINLMQQEKLDVTWKSYIYSVPRGVMGFAMRASTNSLATPDNLARWGKVVDISCKLCSSDQPNSRTTATLGHILNNCPKMLDRYEWRHNGVLAYLYQVMMDSKPASITIHADIEGAKINGGTVPPDILVTAQRPDMVIIDRKTTPPTVYLVELTCPFTRNIEAANTRKRTRYEFLATDIQELGFQCHNFPFEIGSRGHVTLHNRGTLSHLCHVTGIRKTQQVIKNCSKLVLLASYTIFNARKTEDWSGQAYLKP